MDIRVLTDLESLSISEELRCSVYNFDNNINAYYQQKMEDHNLIILGAYINDELIGALYFTPFFDDKGVIDEIFVRSDYQNSIYHVGTTLLKYLEEHLNLINEYLEVCMNKFLISPIDKRAERIYKKQGYKKTMLDGTYFKRVN